MELNAMFDWLVNCEGCFGCIGNEVVVVEVVDDVVDVCLCMLLELCLIWCRDHKGQVVGVCVSSRVLSDVVDVIDVEDE
jgi:hypothetical protein